MPIYSTHFPTLKTAYKMIKFYATLKQNAINDFLYNSISMTSLAHLLTIWWQDVSTDIL